MNLFFEESGDFKAGTVLAQQGESYQVELVSGKRTKVKARDVLIQYAAPGPAEVMQQAQQVIADLDLDFLWEVAGQDEFGFNDLGIEYFGHAPLPHEAAGLLIKLHGAPMYFYRKGRGRYKAAPEESLKAALAGLEKKRQQALIQQQYVDELKAGHLPPPIKPLALQLLFKPDKNSIEYKALEAASAELQTSPSRLMLKTGGVASPRDLHLSKFLFECFPRGTGFPALEVPLPGDLPMADVQAFSIDDVTTTEIDDAFSVARLDDGSIRIGIHIAAPALGIKRGDGFDAIARARMSTVYMPGDKITMLPDAVVDAYTLAEGKACPAISLYAWLNPSDWSVVKIESKAERVMIAANLRHNDLDELATEASLESGEGEYRFKDEIGLLWQWALVLEQGRMAKRAGFGLKPEQTNRVDFNFYVDDDVVSIVRRKRGAPLDKIVAELMIFANSSWGKMLHEHGVPGIYRTQGAGGWANRMQVKMQTHAAPHQGLGVDQYAWSTSPLRRYTDLVNQWQIIACVEHGVTAPLVATFKQKDADLFAIVSAFDAAYGAYAEFQTTMERYWCLRWLTQEDIKRVDAVVLKDEILRLVDIPLVLRLPGMPAVARGSQVSLDLLSWDEIDLSVEARLIEVHQQSPDQQLAAEVLDEAVEDDAPQELVELQAEAEAETETGAETGADTGADVQPAQAGVGADAADLDSDVNKGESGTDESRAA